MTTYECAACKAAVTIKEGKPERICKCDAPVVANIKAVARGAGGVK